MPLEEARVSFAIPTTISNNSASSGQFKCFAQCWWERRNKLFRPWLLQQRNPTRKLQSSSAKPKVDARRTVLGKQAQAIWFVSQRLLSLVQSVHNIFFHFVSRHDHSKKIRPELLCCICICWYDRAFPFLPARAPVCSSCLFGKTSGVVRCVFGLPQTVDSCSSVPDGDS